MNKNGDVIEVPVLIAGGGPVGLSLAADLGWRGQSCMVVERRTGVTDHPRATLLGARSMEYFRRWGIAEDVVAAGLPLDYPIHVIFATRLAGYELHRAKFGTMGEFMSYPPDLWRQVPDAKYSPYFKTQIGQQALEPVLRKFVASFEKVELRYGWRLVDYSHDQDGVLARLVEEGSGREQSVRAQFLVGCDGGKSLVREKLGVRYTGRGAMRPNVSFFFRSASFLEQHQLGRGTLYFIFSHGSFGVFTAINGRDLWNYQHYFLDANVPTRDIDPKEAVWGGMGKPFDFELLRITHWHHHQSVAERYRSGPVFLAGDSAHLFSPTGGVGMNTGIGDAINLSWKLDAVLSGWAGRDLLDSYEVERRPIGVRNSEEAARNADRIDAAMRVTPPNVEEPGPEGDAAREEFAKTVRTLARQFNASGLQLGHRYEGSPICIPDGTPAPPDDPNVYDPVARPGSRAPHLWLKDGRSTLDLFSGREFTLLRLGADRPDASALDTAARRLGVPLVTRDVEQEDVRALYGADLVLVRPDGYVAWRGDRLPETVEGLLQTVRGEPVTSMLALPH
ncbi:FAD-dependent oxidoreductase [Roseomonas chloroacetimidivorans]|uniref:FAD-dependent oxidoreductase n=1 Tax=Roseomonas chloroacetimidivorans TaxID=1766656 RepID=UPI003C754132